MYLRDGDDDAFKTPPRRPGTKRSMAMTPDNVSMPTSGGEDDADTGTGGKSSSVKGHQSSPPSSVSTPWSTATTIVDGIEYANQRAARRAASRAANAKNPESAKSPSDSTPKTPMKIRKKNYSTGAFGSVATTDGLPRGFVPPAGIEMAAPESDPEEPLLYRLVRRKAALYQEYEDFKEFQDSYGCPEPRSGLRVFERDELRNKGWVKDQDGEWGKPGLPKPSVAEFWRHEKMLMSKVARRSSPMKAMKVKTPSPMKVMKIKTPSPMKAMKVKTPSPMKVMKIKKPSPMKAKDKSRTSTMKTGVSTMKRVGKRGSKSIGRTKAALGVMKTIMKANKSQVHKKSATRSKWS